MKVLFDQNCPRPLMRLLTSHDVRTAADEGWDQLSNGDLLSAAERAGFECMVTSDLNIRYQQSLAGRRIALVVISTNAWPIIRANPKQVIAAVDGATAGSYREVTLPRPRLFRRPRP